MRLRLFDAARLPQGLLLAGLLTALTAIAQPAATQSSAQAPVEKPTATQPAVAPAMPAGEPIAVPSAIEAANPTVEKKTETAMEPGDEKHDVVDIILTGDARCTRCHHDVTEGEVDNYPILPMGRTKHGTRADSRTPTCTSCHGESKAHFKQKGKSRPLPDNPYGKKSAADPKAHNRACLNCHEGSKRMHWGGSIHARRDVACNDCHKMHVAHDPATTREKIAEMCMSCHKEKRAQITRPSRHPIAEGKMVCVDCHNAHGSAGPKLMVKDSVNETCYTCHMEYRGPFLWNHQPVRQDCSLCHNPHGSTVAGLLKLRPPFLCQQCHEPTSHRGNFPGINSTNANTITAGGVGPGGLTMARGCPNCHTNIHGGSNPTNAGNSRTNRR